MAKLDEAKYARAVERGVAELDRLRGQAGPEDAEELTTDVMGVIEKACQASMPRSVPKHGKKPVYWWTQEIAVLRMECSKLRQRLQRAKTQSDRDSRSVDYKAARKQLRHTIRRSKILCWRKLARPFFWFGNKELVIFLF